MLVSPAIATLKPLSDRYFSERWYSIICREMSKDKNGTGRESGVGGGIIGLLYIRAGCAVARVGGRRFAKCRDMPSLGFLGHRRPKPRGGTGKGRKWGMVNFGMRSLLSSVVRMREYKAIATRSIFREYRALAQRQKLCSSNHQTTVEFPHVDRALFGLTY